MAYILIFQLPWEYEANYKFTDVRKYFHIWFLNLLLPAFSLIYPPSHGINFIIIQYTFIKLVKNKAETHLPTYLQGLLYGKEYSEIVQREVSHLMAAQVLNI